MEQLKQNLEDKLNNSNLGSKVLLGRFKVIDEASRKTPAYVDERYIPFYYHLGTMLEPKSMAEIGFRLGLCSGCFLKGCKTVESFLAFQEQGEEFYSPRIGKSNIQDCYRNDFDVHVGKILDNEWSQKFNEREWDLVLINEEVTYDRHMEYLDFVWPQISFDGLLVMDYISWHKPAKQAFYNFCKIKNREPISIKTRYGVGIVQK